MILHIRPPRILKPSKCWGTQRTVLRPVWHVTLHLTFHFDTEHRRAEN